MNLDDMILCEGIIWQIADSIQKEVDKIE